MDRGRGKERKIRMCFYQLPYAGMIRIRFQGSRPYASSQPIAIRLPQ
jgi:hypothetical protein